MRLQTVGHAAKLSRFTYLTLEPAVAESVRAAADRIRRRIARTFKDLIVVGKELLNIKDCLSHGQFGPWLQTEFGWTDRTARNFMAVAEQFGPKTAILSDLAITPTAAYLLAAPSAPYSARQAAIDRALAGEAITVAVATALLQAARQRKARTSTLSLQRRCRRLDKALERWCRDCNPQERADIARHLRLLASTLEEASQTVRT